MIHALIDSDTISYASAVCSEGAEEYVAISRLDRMANGIIEASGCSTFQMYVSGGVNFRYAIDPTYKGHRLPSPEHREACHQHLITHWGAIETDGYEADDAVGVEQKLDGSTMIVGIDKDLLQIPGKHFQWAIIRNGIVVREEKHLEISEEEGMRNFFTQMLTGDVSDNIKGIHGIGKVKAPKLLADLHTEEEMYNAVYDAYTFDEEDDGTQCCNRERFYRNLDLLWLWRQLGVTYSIRREIYGTY